MLLSALLCFKASSTAAQCSHKIDVKDVKVDERRMIGSFSLDVNTSSAFKGSIIQLRGTSQQITESFSGNGYKEFSFTKLEIADDIRYRAMVEFSSENSLLCKKKFIDVDLKSATR